MNLADILWRNQGNVLTPELITGLLYADRLVTCEVPIAIQGDWVAKQAGSRLVLDQHERVAKWVAEQTDCSDHAWAGYVCLGMEDATGELVAGIVLESYNGVNANVHIAGIGKNWMSKNMLLTFFIYTFNHLKLIRLTGLVAASNKTALDFDYHVGFKHEATLKDAAVDGDMEVLVMRREDCRFLRYLNDAGDSGSV